MKRRFFLLINLLLLVVITAAQDLTAFQSLRYDEDYTYFKNDTTYNWYRLIKYKPLDAAAESYLSFGGDMRFQYLWFNNEQWGDAPVDKDGYVLARYLVHADLHSGRRLRVFAQLQSSIVSGRIETNPVEENPLEVHQAFADVLLAKKNQSSLLFRVGRQEFMYGSQRLVSTRELPNNRQSFDAVKSIWKMKDLQLDLFYSHYVAARKGIFDDGFNAYTKFWGAYLVKDRLAKHTNIDLYYFGLWRKEAVFDDGEADELRHSVGMRIWNRLRDFTYDYEAVYQWGNFGDGSINAWTISFNSLYRFSQVSLRPEVGVKAELITGDAFYNDSRLQSFNPMFPRGAYFGLAAFIGPSNLMDLHPSVSLDLQKRLKLSVDADIFWRFSRNDGVYEPNMALIYSGKNIPSKFIGSQYAADLVCTPNKFLYLRTEFTWFAAGSFLEAAGTGNDILFTSFTAQLKF